MRMTKEALVARPPYTSILDKCTDIVVPSSPCVSF
jgi:hypothetical protein